MGRRRGTVIRKSEKVCKYCGAGVSELNDVCGNCRVKAKLWRTIQQMVKDTYERELENERRKFN